MTADQGFRCPFCGEAAKRDSEHVWAQWMRKTPAAQLLLRGSHGRRIQRIEAAIALDESGKYTEARGQARNVAELLPHVQVDVCKPCNGGWMSDLESRVQRLLGPWSKAGWPVRLTPDDQTLLATWATKSWMAYALLSGRLKNPFRTPEYRDIAKLPQPLARSQVWLVHSDAPTAYVGMGVSSTLLNFESSSPDMSSTPDNSGYAFLAYDEWVLFLVLAPSQNGEIMDVLGSDVAQIPTALQIWPPSPETFYPKGTASSADMSRLLGIAGELHRGLGLPVVGLTPDDVNDVRAAYLAGVEPWQLRAKWAPDDVATLQRHRLKVDPDGYGRTPAPHIALGTIAWHSGDYAEAVRHYQHAHNLGASMKTVGSQLCDALMWAGRYSDALKISDDLGAGGLNEWRDLFRAEILWEIVEHLQVSAQDRDTSAQVTTDQLESASLEDLRSRLVDHDALDPLAWVGIVSRSPGDALTFGMLFAAAYLANHSPSWIAIVSHTASTDGAEIELNALRDGLGQSPGVAEMCHAVVAELDKSEDNASLLALLDSVLEAKSRSRA